MEVYNGGDVDALLELVHPDALAIVPDTMPNAGTYRGREGVRTMVEQWNEAWEQALVEPLAVASSDDVLIISVRQRGRGIGSGVDVAADMVWVVGERDGKLDLWRLCQTLDEAYAFVATR